MLDLINKLIDVINNGSVFWFCALSGTGMLVIQFLMGLSGTDHHLDHHEMDQAGGSIDDGKFKWMSKQAITGFLMMFGWVGLACSQEFNFSLPVTLLISLGAGTFSAFTAALIFHLAKKAHSRGTIFKVEDALGKEAIVYHRIPKGGTGKITISLHHFTHEIDAISPYAEEIPSFTSVQIINKADDKTVVVIPLK